jgi:hypothetical protein
MGATVNEARSVTVAPAVEYEKSIRSYKKLARFASFVNTVSGIKR